VRLAILPLPATTSCPNCGTPVQTDASFCGQCGFNLRSTSAIAAEPTVGTDFSSGMPDLVPPDQLVQPEPLTSNPAHLTLCPYQRRRCRIHSSNRIPPAELVFHHPNSHHRSGNLSTSLPPPSTIPPYGCRDQNTIAAADGTLLHVQTDTLIELPQNLSVIHRQAK